MTKSCYLVKNVVFPLFKRLLRFSDVAEAEKLTFTKIGNSNFTGTPSNWFGTRRLSCPKKKQSNNRIKQNKNYLLCLVFSE